MGFLLGWKCSLLPMAKIECHWEQKRPIMRPMEGEFFHWVHVKEELILFLAAHRLEETISASNVESCALQISQEGVLRLQFAYAAVSCANNGEDRHHQNGNDLFYDF